MADAKVSALTALTAPADEDLFYVVDDPSGTPTSKKITLAYLRQGVFTGRKDFHVLDYGAVGDGATDDTTAIQDAIDAAEVAGGRVVFASGQTHLVTGLTVDDNVILDGHGATLKLDVLSSSDGSAIVELIGANIIIRDLKFDGDESNQTADGFSDAFSSTGRSYRAAIKGDGSSYTINNIAVVGCEFTAVYGGCIALQDVDDIRIIDNYAHDTNFELAFIYRTAGTNDRIVVANNVMDTIASGDGSVNANGILLSYPNDAVVEGNVGYNVERCFVKLEHPTDVTVSGNTFDTNTVDNFSAVQFQGTTQRVTITGNTIRNVGAGITDNSTTTTQSIVITNNTIDTITGSTTGDGMSIGAASSTVTDYLVADNILRGVARYGIVARRGSRLTIRGNQLYGPGSTSFAGIYLYANANMDNVVVSDNLIANWSAGGSQGGLYVSRASTFAFTDLFILNNVIDAGGSGNRGIYNTVDITTGGAISGNYVDGSVQFSSDVIFRDNYCSGTLTMATSAAKWPKHLTGTTTWDPGSIGDGDTDSTTVTVTGASVGDIAVASFSSITAADWLISAAVTSANTVTVTILNETGGAVDLASGTVRADVWVH